ncbi:MAG: MarR family winged helix-turn-helix transcriptional regulator [Burkholderiaceae bacterium]
MTALTSGKLERKARELNQLLTAQLSRVQAKLNAHASRTLREHGSLSLMQWRILVMLDLLDQSTHAQIVRYTGFDAGQLSRAIKRMVELGLVASQGSPSDGRQQMLTITKAGRHAFEKAQPHMRRRRAKLLNCLSKPEQEVLVSALAKLEAATEDDVSSLSRPSSAGRL